MMEPLQPCMLSISDILIADSNPPNLRDVFMMYCSMTHGTTLRDLCVRFNPQALRIDERKLVQFGLLHKLIRRVHKVITSHMNSVRGCDIVCMNCMLCWRITDTAVAAVSRTLMNRQ
jgi:hypothetical protein